MARAKTIEAVGENEVGRNGPLPFHNTCCRMEVPRPLHNWPPTLGTAARTTGSGPGVAAVHLHARLEPLQALNLLPVPHPEGPEETQQVLPLSTPPSSPVGDQRDESSRGTDAPGERSGSDQEKEEEEYQQVSSRQGPLPDLLPQNEHLSRAAPHPRGPGGEAALELDVRRVAGQLRMIGDEFNDTILRRAHAGPPWRDWRDVCRGLVGFIAQTLSTLYRLT